jgi:hypothetical protein
MLRFSKAVVLAAFGLFPLAAHAAPLTVVNVGAPAINCVFNATCAITVTDSVGNFTPPGDSGTGRLQSRTYIGAPPAPLAGKMGYEYRVDMTPVSGATASTCVNAIQFTFGPIVKGPYTPAALADMFVVTSGGLGSVGVSSATRSGAIVIVNFAGGGVCPGQTSYFFGLASASTTPVPGTAKLFYTPAASGTTAVRVP